MAYARIGAMSVHTDDDDDDDHEACGWQASELNLAKLAQNDFEFAYRLQLEEAIQASKDGHQGPSEVVYNIPSPEDRSLAFSFQTLEVSKSQQQASDLRHTILETERLQRELLLRDHDAKFAQAIYDADDKYWDEYGDHMENPFKPEYKDADLPTFKVYVASVVSASVFPAHAAVGAVIMDDRNIVVTEIKKPLDSGVSKAAADYMSLIAGLEALIAMGMQKVDAFTDSVVVFNQVTRRWRVHKRLYLLYQQVMELAQSFKQFHLNVVPLNENSHALRLARGARNFQPSSEDTEEALEAAEMDKFCPICLEKKKKNEMLEVSGCHHGFCRVCVIQHMEVKIQAGQVPVRCPHVNCTQTFSLSECQSILSQKWTDILNKRLIEINMPESERVYCPFPKCSALMNRKDLVSNHDGASSSSSSSSSFSQSLAPSRCMECFRLFCMDCRVLWHTNMTCREYQQLPLHLRNAQDAKLQQLAMKQRWQRCGKCSRMIELAEGCYHMTCWCGYQFCYLCGEPWKNDKQSCKCRLWDEDYLLEGPLTESDSDEWEGSVDGSDDLAADYEDWQDLVDLNTRVLVDTRIPIIHDRYYKTKLCRYWERGCYMGEDCRFAHGEAELRGI